MTDATKTPAADIVGAEQKTPEEIAAGLTPAQGKRLLIGVRNGHAPWRGPNAAGTVDVFVRLGLYEKTGPGWSCFHWEPTPLGRQVAAVLRGEETR